MSELVFRKMICNAGHESRPYGPNEMLPKMCPVCYMRYDRKYNQPIKCLEDGTVPSEEVAVEEPVAEPVVEAPVQEVVAPAERAGGRRGQVAETFAPEEGRRGRRGSAMPAMPQNMDPAAARRGRRAPEPVPVEEPVIPAVTPEPERNPYERENLYTGGATRLALFTGGDCIRIPEGGCTLGRESFGAEYLGMNPLISRRHAYVESDRLGIVRVRDEGSLNGTYVDDGNGKRKIKPFETVELRKGNTIWLANHVLAIEER